MKHSRAAISTGTNECHLSLRDFARFASFLTFGVTVLSFVIYLPGAFVHIADGNPEVFYITPCLWLLGVLAVWLGTLSVGCLVTTPVWIWMLCKRLAGKSAEKTTSQGRLWDQWMDGPEPL